MNKLVLALLILICSYSCFAGVRRAKGKNFYFYSKMILINKNLVQLQGKYFRIDVKPQLFTLYNRHFLRKKDRFHFYPIEGSEIKKVQKKSIDSSMKDSK